MSSSRNNRYSQFVQKMGRNIPSGSIPQTQSTIPESSPSHSTEPPTAASATQLTVEELICLPGRDGLDKLDPTRPPGTFWFGIDSKVGRSVADTIKGFFTEPHVNWSQTPDHIRKTWFKSFAQKWQWDISIHELVKKEFENKAARRLVGNVSDWKRNWAAKGNNAKPKYISEQVWNGLVAYWTSPQAQTVAAKCSMSRLSNTDGHGPHKHTSGQTSYAGRRVLMANGGELPPITEVFAATHKRKDGSFVDERSQTIFNEVTTKVMERQSQSSCGSTHLSVTEQDKIFEEVAPKNRGRTFGLGSIREVSAAKATTSHQHPDELKLELDMAHKKIKTLEINYSSILEQNSTLSSNFNTIMEQNQTICRWIDMIAPDEYPLLARTLRARNQGGPGEASTSAAVPTGCTEDVPGSENVEIDPELVRLQEEAANARLPDDEDEDEDEEN